MTRTVRAALTQTRNVSPNMPTSVEALPSIAGELDALRDANLDHHRELIAKAAAQGAKIICLGELFSGPYFALDRLEMWRALAEDANTGPSVEAMRAAARDNSIIVIAPIYELTPEGKRFNTAVVIDESGAILGKYRKCHIPEGTNDQGSFCETYYYDKSDGQLGNPSEVGGSSYFPVFDTSVGKVGVSICYDRHFPGVARALADGGAEMIFSPAVTFGSKSQRMWEMEFAVDATRHLLFIGGSNRQGSEPPWNQPYFGASYFVGPNGRLDELATDTDELVIADLPLHQLSGNDPSGWNFPRDARPDIY